MFLKYTLDKDLEETRLSLNPVSSNFLSKQKLNDCLLEILTEWERKKTSFQPVPLWNPRVFFLTPSALLVEFGSI